MSRLRTILQAERWLVAIVLVALLVRAAAVLWLSDTVPYSDAMYYDMAALKMAEDWRFPFDRAQIEPYAKLGWWPPGYPAFLAAVYKLTGGDYRTAALVQAVLGALLCVVVHRIGRRAGGERMGNWAALLVALNPTYVFYTNILASENLFVVMLALGLWCAGRPWTRWQTPVIAGLLFGMGAMVRAIGLAVPLVVALVHRRQPGLDRRAWRRGALVLLAAAAIPVLPWTLRNYLLTGTPALVCFGGGLNFYFGHNPASIGYRDLAETPMARLTSQAAVDREGYRLGFEYLGQQPLQFIPRAMHKLWALGGSAGYAPHASSAILLPENWQTDPVQGRIATELRARQRAKNVWLDGLFTQWASLHSWLLMIGGAVACMIGWRRLPIDLRVCAWLIAYWIGAHVIFWGTPRFRYPMEVPLALLTAYVIVRVAARRTVSESRPAAPVRRG